MFPASILESVHALSVSCVSVFPRSKSLPRQVLPPGFCSAMESLYPVCSALVCSYSVCSVVVIFCPICSALVCCSVCSVVVVLSSTYTAGSVLGSCSAGYTLAIGSLASCFAGFASVTCHSTYPWTWPSIPLLRLHSTTLLYYTISGASGNRYWGGGGCSVTNLVHSLPFTHHQSCTHHQRSFALHMTSCTSCCTSPRTTVPIIHCTDDTQLNALITHIQLGKARQVYLYSTFNTHW